MFIPNKVRANMWRTVDYDGDGALDLIVGVGDWTEYGWDNAYTADGRWMNGPLRGYVYFIRNTGTNAAPTYDKPKKVMAEDRPVETYGWPSPNFADFDGDGDLDLLCGEFLDGFTYFENTGTRTKPKYALVRRVKTPEGAYLTMDLEMITPTAIDWDKDGDLDLIVGDEDGRVAFVENTGKFDDKKTPVFLAPRYFQQEADTAEIRRARHAGRRRLGRRWRHRTSSAAIPRATSLSLKISAARKSRSRSGPRRSGSKPAAKSSARWPARMAASRARAKRSGVTPRRRVADWDGDGLPDILANSILGKVHVVSKHRHAHRAEARRGAADRSRVERPAAHARLRLAATRGQGAAHAMAHHARSAWIGTRTASPIS